MTKLKAILNLIKLKIRKTKFSDISISVYVIIALVLYIGYLKWFECQKPTTTTTTTETVLDSARVDSFETVISYLKDLPPDTIRVNIPIPVPSSVDTVDNDVVRTYNTSYSDSFIAAHWRSRVNGMLVDQQFEYIPKSQQVIERRMTISRDFFYGTTTTIERVYDPKGYLSAGGFIGVTADRIQMGPTLHFTTPKQHIFTVQYDALNKGVIVGASFKLSFKDLLPW